MSRTPRPLHALVLVAMLSAGCASLPAGTATRTGGTSTVTSQADSGGGTSTDTARQQAVKFSECMRAKGVRQFPDPDSSGTLTIDAVANGSSIDTNGAAFQQAIAACKDLQPPGFTGHKRTAQEQQGALQFAQCIRDNGVKDFPDPAPDEPLIDTNRIPSAANGLAPINAAMQKCRDFAAKAGVVGGR